MDLYYNNVLVAFFFKKIILPLNFHHTIVQSLFQIAWLEHSAALPLKLPSSDTPDDSV